MKFIVFCIFGSISTFCVQAEKPSWKNSPEHVGNFLEIPPFHALYEFGWVNVRAATAQVMFDYSGDYYFFSANGGTYGWARKLWQIDATQTASGLRSSWLPKKMKQTERYRHYTMLMDVQFHTVQADRLRMALPTSGKVPARKIFTIPHMRDMVAAMLFVRSQPLRNGEEISQVVFPGDSAFFVHLKVLGRENIRYRGKLIPTIQLSLHMQKILMEGPQKGSLIAHHKFDNGVIWISDDANRIPMRAELTIFVGYVYAQLRSVQFH